MTRLTAKQTIVQMPFVSKLSSNTRTPTANFGFFLSKEPNEKIVDVHFYVDLFEDAQQTRQFDKIHFMVSYELEIERTALTDEEYFSVFKAGALIAVQQANIVLGTKYGSKTKFKIPSESQLRLTYLEMKKNPLPEDEQNPKADLN
jgi:hypothetical protein